MNWLDIVALDDSDNRADPLYLQIVRRFKESIQSGKLPIDSRLPTNRELSALLNVDRSTVARAYLELSEQGLTESHVGRGTFVKASRPQTQDKRVTSHPEIVWSEKFSRASQTLDGILARQPVAAGVRADIISFGGGIPTEEFYPSEQFQRIVTRMVKSGRTEDMFEYSPADGNAELRTEVVGYLRRQGLSVVDDELLIVSGSQQGIDLVSMALVDEGDVVVLEEPSYFWAICNFRARQARLIGVPVDQEGMRMDALESVLSRQKVKLIYIMPSFQNPTGATLSTQRRKRLLELAREYQVPVLEDNFVGELVYDGERMPSLRTEPGAREIIIHQGTFSKALCPGLRLGWLVAPAEVMARLKAAKRASDLSTNSMAQVILAHYLKEGLYSQHLEHVRRAYRLRRDAMVRALERYVAPLSISQELLSGRNTQTRVTWQKPDGGLFVWLKLPGRLSCRELLAYAEREGVTFSPGELFFVGGDQPEFMRLCFIQTDEEVIEEGIRRLSRAVEAYFDDVTRLRASQKSVVRRGSEGVLI